MKYFGIYADFTLDPDLAPGYLTGPDNAVGDILDINIDLTNGVYRAWLVNRFGTRIGYLDDELSAKLALLAADDMICRAILSFVAYTSYTDKQNKKVNGAASGTGRGNNELLEADRGNNETLGISRGTSDNSNNVESRRTASQKHTEETAPLENKSKTDYKNYGYYWGNVAVICFSRTDEVLAEVYVHNVADKISHDIRPKLGLGAESANQIVESGGSWLPTQTVMLPETQPNMVFIKRRRQSLERLIDQGRAGNKGCYAITIAFFIIVIVAIALAIKGCVGW